VSLDNPNDHEQRIEEYAEAVRRHIKAMKDVEDSTEEERQAREDRQAKWREVSCLINRGIKPGIYRLKPSHGEVDAIEIDPNRDYPPIRPMFR
jgi:hypothetical protein